MSAVGPTRTSRDVRAYVACWVKADVAEGQEHQAASLVRRRNGSAQITQQAGESRRTGRGRTTPVGGQPGHRHQGP